MIFDYIIDIIPNMNKQKEIYKNNIYIQKLVDTLIKEVTDFHIIIILADSLSDYEKKLESLKGSDTLLIVIENDIQRLVDKGFISIKRGMYEKYKKGNRKFKISYTIYWILYGFNFIYILTSRNRILLVIFVAFSL